MWLLLIIIIGTSIWVFFDAKKIGVKKTDEKSFVNFGPVGWLLCCLGLQIVTFPLYLIKRSDLKKKFQTEISPAPSRPVSAQSSDYEQQLRKLAKLKEDGIISQEEFDKKKKELLNIQPQPAFMQREQKERRSNGNFWRWRIL